MAIFSKFYSKQSLWTLFLVCGFPIHIWTILLALRDFQWIAARTNSWDMFAVASYGLVIAAFESTCFFIFALILGFFISNAWNQKKRLHIISVLIIVLSFWSMISQAYFLLQFRVPQFLLMLIINTKYPDVAVYVIVITVVTLSILIPVVLLLKSLTLERLIDSAFEKLSLLMVLYLFFDALALGVVIIRNF